LVEEERPVNKRVSNEFDELIAVAKHGRTTRRELLRRAGYLGISAAALPYVLRNRGVAAQDATPVAEAGSTIVVPANIRTDLAGQSITAYITSPGTGEPFANASAKKFSDATGITVNLVNRPESTTDTLNLVYLPALNAGSSDLDVIMIDVIWPGILEKHAVDLTATLAAEGAEFFDRIVQNNTVNGTLVGLPWYTDAGLLYYRKDLLEKYGFAAPPATWAELETQATTIADGEKAANADFYGFTWQGNAYEGLTCNALEWQVSNGGGAIIESDGTVSVNNDQAKAAFDRAKAWVGGISPAGVTTYGEEESRGVWQAGNSAFMRNWPYAFSLGQAADSPIKDKFDVTLIPKGDGEGAQNADTLGGWQLLVSKYSKAPDAAIEFAKYLASPEIQRSRAIELSLLPTIPSVYDEPDVLAVNPYYASLKPIFLGGAVARPSTVTGEYYDDVSTAYFTAVSQILTGQGDTDSLISTLADDLQAIMDEKNG
jgi:trehalose/maltose transport system substrate-binding protein